MVAAAVLTLLLPMAAAKRSIAVRLHRAAAVPRMEAILPVVVRLTDGELGIGTRRGGLAFGTRQRGAYQPAVHGTFIARFRIPVCVSVGIHAVLDGRFLLEGLRLR